jgi:hypothetical protein
MAALCALEKRRRWNSGKRRKAIESNVNPVARYKIADEWHVHIDCIFMLDALIKRLRFSRTLAIRPHNIGITVVGWLLAGFRSKPASWQDHFLRV